MRRRRFQYSPKGSGLFALNVTSMTDMFTIMLVFLLQTYNTSNVEINPDMGQRLPASASEANPVLSYQLSLNKNELKLEEKVLAKIKDYDFSSGDIDKNDSNFIKPLFDELYKISQQKNEKDPKGVTDGRLILKADSDFSYQTLRKVLYTASMAGFPKVKLATVVGH
jgi:biopolymer transport protein ExbD